jgi:phosphate acetyltransferase
MLALSAISRLIGTKLPGHGSLWTTQEFQFRQPVLVGDTITATVTLEQISLGAQMIKLKTEVVNKTTGTVVLTGSARVRIPPRQVKV